MLSCEGSGSLSGVISGIEWATSDAEAHPDQSSVISMSLGGSFSAVENAAVAAAVAAGVSVIAVSVQPSSLPHNRHHSTCTYLEGIRGRRSRLRLRGSFDVHTPSSPPSLTHSASSVPSSPTTGGWERRRGRLHRLPCIGAHGDHSGLVDVI